jgi:hypothetical protein
MGVAWQLVPAGLRSAGESGASAGISVLLAALVLGVAGLAAVIVVSERSRRRGGAGDRRAAAPWWRQSEDPGAPVLRTPHLDEVRRRIHADAVTEASQPADATPAEPPQPSWTAASRDVTWRENGRREAFPLAVVRGVEAQVAAEQPRSVSRPEPSPPPVARSVVSAAGSAAARVAVSVPEVEVRTEPEIEVRTEPQVSPDPEPYREGDPALVRLTVDSLERTTRVATTRDRLLALRHPAEDVSAESLWEARTARACLLSLLPLVLLTRQLFSPGWVDAARATSGGTAGLAAVVLLGLVGSVWVWRATTPPYLLFPHRTASRRRRRMRDVQVWEHLALRLAASAAPPVGWSANDDLDDDVDDDEPDLVEPATTVPSVDEAVATVAQLRLGLDARPRFLEGQVATAALLPFLVLIAPAIAIAVVL